MFYGKYFKRCFLTYLAFYECMIDRIMWVYWVCLPIRDFLWCLQYAYLYLWVIALWIGYTPPHPLLLLFSPFWSVFIIIHDYWYSKKFMSTIFSTDECYCMNWPLTSLVSSPGWISSMQLPRPSGKRRRLRSWSRHVAVGQSAPSTSPGPSSRSA